MRSVIMSPSMQRMPDLVVDDNEVNLKIVVGLAKNTKLQIDTALSAAEGLKLIRQHSYQLLLIDHMMPEMDGIEMLQHVKTMDGGIYKDIPAVAITAMHYRVQSRLIWMPVSADICRSRSIRNALNRS